MAVDEIDRIKRLAPISMFSDDRLMDQLVLKGGNALDLVYGITTRASLDLDFSISGEFSEYDLRDMNARVERAFDKTFQPEGYRVFDVRFIERPPNVTADMAAFWGGYRIEFKVIKEATARSHPGSLEQLRRNAIVVGSGQLRTFQIDISKFEYCVEKQKRLFDGYTIYVYSPEMLVVEKLRSICQQLPDYAEVVANPSRSARARDFVDIVTIMDSRGIDLSTSTCLDLLRCVFEAKRVPLAFLGRVATQREYHRPDFTAVQSTVRPTVQLMEFDAYFDRVVAICSELTSLLDSKDATP